MSSSSGRGGRAGGGGYRGGGGGGRGAPSDRSGDFVGRGRGQLPAVRGGAGARGGRGRDGGGGRGYNAPPAETDFPSLGSASVTAPSQVSALSREVEEKLHVQSSASSSTSPESENVLPPASSKALRFPARPGFGTFGRKCLVRANHFMVETADKDIHHYDVSVTPEVTSKNVCRRIMIQLVASFQTKLNGRMLAYDGRKSVYTAGSLPFSSQDFDVKLPSDGARKEKEFKVSIKFAGKADVYHLQQFLRRRRVDAPQETIQALDVVLRETPSLNYEVVGRSFFHPSLGDKGELGDGLEYWKGFYQSLRPTQMGLSLNIDISARAFYEPILVTEYIGKYLGIRDWNRTLSDQDRVKVKKTLRGIRVEISHGDYFRRYKISGISTQPLSQLSFSPDGTGTNVSIVQYFRQKYDIVLKNTSLPAIQSGSDTKPAYLPMEICRIVGGQRYSRRLNEKQVRALLRGTCQRPVARENNIREMVRKNDYNANQLVHHEFGIQVKSELTSIDARVLPPPMLKYHESRVNPTVGAWNMIDKQMVNGGKVDYWTCISFSRRLHLDDVNKFCHALVGMCCSRGMSFAAPSLPIQTANPSQMERTLVNLNNQSIANKKQLQLLIVILPDASGSYGTIKRVCETELGIVSQCCKPEQAYKKNKQYLENVSLKINVKVGGRNTVLEQAVQKKIPFLTDVPTIIFGADVTHPQPGEDFSPSIAAVVASMDWPEVTKYRGQVSAQRPREEIIQDLYKKSVDPQRGIIHGGMIREHLLAFYKSTQQKPSRIIFYRDGVSEGQFSQVLLFEMDAIRQACSSLQEGYLPRVTFIVVQKRHHTRLFPANHGDRNLTDEWKYIASHAGIQGTSRPAHYHVLLDENSFTADALQSLTNNLCYTYARCTRSVSIVPPAYYAHLLAFRARYYIEGEASESGSTGGGRASRERTADVSPLPAIKDNVKNVMFYC